MDLILQSLNADTARLHHLAELALPEQIIALSPHCLRCQNITITDNQSAINELAYQEQIDVYWSESPKNWTDFKLLAMDMDSTLITIECIDEIADMHGLKPQVAAITESAMRGDIAFAESLTQRVALLKGLPAAALQQVYDERLKLSPGAEKMLRAVQERGIKTLLVSGGFTFFTDRMKSRLNLDYSHANQLEIVNNTLTGRLMSDIVDAEGKRNAVEKVCAEMAISPQNAIVMGDGANDLAMMSVAGLSVAFRAKPVVRAKADVALNFVGLDGILNLF